MRRILIGLAACAALTSAAQAQGLRDQISQLFIFGPGQDPLFLAGTASNTSATGYADRARSAEVPERGD